MAAPWPPCRRLPHWTVCILAAGYALVQVHDCLSRFLAEPVSSHRDTVFMDQLPTPAITLCNPILDGPTVYYIVPEDDNMGMSDLPWHEFGNETIPYLLDVAAVGAEEALDDCRLRGQPCSTVGAWSRRLHSSVGDCFTFTPNTSEPIQLGDGYEVTFLLPSNVYGEIKEKQIMHALIGEKFIDLTHELGNMRLSVFVHPADEPFSSLPWIQPQEPLYVRSGERAEVRVTLEDIERVSQRHLPCESRPGYSSARCSLLCHAEAASAATGLDCRVTDMPTTAALCGNFANYSAVQRAFTTAAGAQAAMGECRQRCPRPCRQRRYLAALGSSLGQDETRLRQFSMRIYYGGEPVQLYRELWSYGASALVGEAGGVLGLMLGLSVLSVFEAVSQLVESIVQRVSARVGSA
ncbi:Acid-sensing ion channel 4-A [Amphibalanus amphitrite]|uniref:Acid-sensing ion channel 4-A n=1 Tax=Amphibalanus amphitrite TaxID=1232801 RepID=A0A6A4VUX6_AMPAM|nr:Acid-sensing ion channel 4-A [Amphibalanus amphitrite]